MINYLQAREIADRYLAEEYDSPQDPVVIREVVPHRFGWEFLFTSLRHMEFTSKHPLRGILIGPGPFVVDRRDGTVTAFGSVDYREGLMAHHRRYDAETGEVPEHPLGRTCGC